MIGRAIGVVLKGDVVVPRVRTQEVVWKRLARIGRVLTRGQKAGPVRKRVQRERLAEMASERAEVRNIEQGAVSNVLLDAERDVVDVRRFLMAVVTVRVAGE